MRDDFESFEGDSKSDAKSSSNLMSEVNSARSESTTSVKAESNDSITDSASKYLASLSIFDGDDDKPKAPAADKGEDKSSEDSGDKKAAGGKGTDKSEKTEDGGPKPADGGPKPGDGPQKPSEEAEATLKKYQFSKEVNDSRGSLELQIDKLEKGMDKDSDQFKKLEQMRKDADEFEKRAANQKPPLSPEEVAKFYKEVGHMIEVKDGPGVPIKLEDRITIAEQTMHHAAKPGEIDQGDHNTCNVTTVEARMFARNPAAAAHMISEVSTTGKYHTPGNPSVEVTVDPNSLKPHRNSENTIEELTNPPGDGQRSYASQVFQVTAVNLGHKTQDLVVEGKDGQKTVYPAGSVEYRQENGDPGAKPPHNGEILYDMRKTPPEAIKDGDGKIVRAPSLEDGQIPDIYNKITGANPPEKGIMVASEGNTTDYDKSVTKIHSEEELKKELETAKAEGRLPLVIKVNSGQEPFASDANGIAAGGKGGAHVVTVTLDDSGKIMMDNQWGAKSRHEISLHELYVATLTPQDAVKALEKDCAANAAKGEVNYAKELELIRLRHTTGDLKDPQYTEQLVYLTKKAVKDAEQNHGGQLDERTTKNLQNMIGELPEKNRKFFEEQCWESVTKSIMQNDGKLTGGDGKPLKTPESYGDNSTAAAKAKDLYDGGNQWIYFTEKDYNKMYDAIKGKSPAELAEMDREFQKAHGMTMEQYITKSLKNHPEQRDKALAILHEQRGEEQKKAA